jgi:hypothetical protein
LKDAPPSLFEGITAKFNFAVHPFLSGSLSREAVPNAKRDLTRVDNALRREYSIKQYYELGKGDAPVWFAFEGPAARFVTSRTFWVGMQHGDIGLVLGGSAQFAIGSQAKREGEFSVSVDPIRALLETFRDPRVRHAATQLAFAWGTIMNNVSCGGVLPRVEGLAIFARTFLMDDDGLAKVKAGARAALMSRRVKASTPARKVESEDLKIRLLVVGTPLYVRQV